MSQLLRFVTDNVDKIPTVQYNDDDLHYIKMDNMESTIQRLQETVYAMLARTAELAGSGSARPSGGFKARGLVGHRSRGPPEESTQTSAKREGE